MKILMIFLIFFIACKGKIAMPTNTLHGLTFEYLGEVDKPFPILLFYDSSKKDLKTNYYNIYIIENNMLNNLSRCIPKYSDFITPNAHPLYKITSIYEKSQDFTYIVAPQVLNSFIDCVEMSITKNNFYIAYIELQRVRMTSTK